MPQTQLPTEPNQRATTLTNQDLIGISAVD